MLFARHIGIDYSGAETPGSLLAGLRVFLSENGAAPQEVPPPTSLKRYWTRQSLAEWLLERFSEDVPTLAGLDHGFSFPLAYFDRHRLAPDWPEFLDDFKRYWPTDAPNTYVDFIREGVEGCGDGAARLGNPRWKRVCELRTKTAKSVFHFDVPGSVAKSTFAGLPWLRFLRMGLGERLHFWPFDGFAVPAGRSAIAEVYPALWNKSHPQVLPTRDQHDAFVIAAELSRADAEGRLQNWLAPALTDDDRAVAAVEGWILGVG